MEDANRVYPSEENIGRECLYWSVGDTDVGCCFPKLEMSGRTSCEGLIDDVCLYLKQGRRPSSLSQEQITELKTRVPDFDPKTYIPTGTTSSDPFPLALAKVPRLHNMELAPPPPESHRPNIFGTGFKKAVELFKIFREDLAKEMELSRMPSKANKAKPPDGDAEESEAAVDRLARRNSDQD